jgi:hypothetical protein
MVAVAVVGVATWAFARYERNWTYYASGWWEAERELWQGRATLYRHGGLRLGDRDEVDRETGLPVERYGGCLVMEGERERAAGHNAHIAQYVRWHGLPKNSLKAWEKELFDLKGYFAARSRTEAPRRLVAGGPAEVSPDSRNALRPVGYLMNDGSTSDGLKVVVTTGKATLDDWYVRYEQGESFLLWGPDGSRFAVVRSTDDKIVTYKAYDLRTGRVLRTEYWSQGESLGEGNEVLSADAF